jgi:hypothetical protein
MKIESQDRIAIAAAVKALFGPTATVRGSRPAPARRETGWAREGRAAIQLARQVRLPRGRK